VSIGATLAAARRRAGLTVSEVSHSTRVTVPIIRGIELDDYAACGGDFYARGHIRAIARAVGEDPLPLIDEFDSTWRSAKEITAAEAFEPGLPLRKRERRRVRWTAVLAVLVLAVLGFASYKFVSGVGRDRRSAAASPRLSPPAARTSLPASSYAGCHHDVESPIDEKNTGVLFLNSAIGQRDVTDGVANTLYVAEKLTLPGDLGWMSGTRATLRNTGSPINAADPADAGQAVSDLTVGGFSAGHPAGCNMLFGDSAIRFVNQQIDPPVLQQLGSRADGKLVTEGPTREP